MGIFIHNIFKNIGIGLCVKWKYLQIALKEKAFYVTIMTQKCLMPKTYEYLGFTVVGDSS